MYEELIMSLRICEGACNKECVLYNSVQVDGDTCQNCLCAMAADAIEGLSRVAEAIPHRCECCVGCELEKKNGGCDHAFVLSPKRAMQYLSKPRWIPVTERLPEGDNRILVCSKLRKGEYWQSVCRFANNLHEVDEYDFPNERRPGFYYYDDEYGWIEKTGVTHWMPLPEPPKEETE